jgi:ATP-dependent helicase STH1/SNF2
MLVVSKVRFATFPPFCPFVQLWIRYIAAVAQAHAQAQPQLGAQRPSQQMYTSTQSAPDPQPPSLPSLSDPVPPNPPLESLAPRPESMPSPPAQVALTESQMATLKSQVAAFRYVQRGLPIPLNLQSAVEAHHEPNYTRAIVKDDIQKVVANGVEQAPKPEGNGVKDENKEAEVVVPTLVYPDGPILERDESSSIYPYNAYTNPYTLLRQPPKSNHPVIIPSVMPLGLDPHAILAERNRYIDARIAQRIRELSDLPSTMGEGGLQPPSQLQTSGDPRYANSKLKALIELKSLRLRDKQRALRSSVVQRLHEAASLVGDRKEYRRYRKQTARDARATEQLERKQRADREHRAKQKHLDYLHTICEHGRNMVNNNRIIQAKAAKLGKAILKFHVDTEREEQKRIEKLSRDRLKALKADDEEAYLKLIDTAKDTRITHLIRQTDSYLEGLAQAVVAQQNDDVHRSDRDLHMSFEQETVPADETMFGATRPDDENPEERGNKVDYYGVAHKISEKVTAQPGMLIGGTLKEYQIKGLQWMVSLFNNKLNGILADEMVGVILCSLRAPQLIHVIGSRQNHPNHFANRVPHRDEEAKRPLPRRRPSLHSHELDARIREVGALHQYSRVQRRPRDQEAAARADQDESIPGPSDYVRVYYQR